MDKEATDRGTISISPVVIKQKETTRRNSTGKSISIASLSLSSSGGKILPHYLRPSTGSCHDFCKYGRKNPYDAEEKDRFLRRFLASKMVPDKDQNRAKSSDQGERRKKPVIESRALAKLKFEFSNTPTVDKKKALSPTKDFGLFEKHNIKIEMPSPTLKSIVSAEQAILPASPENKLNQVIKPNTSVEPKIFHDKAEVYKQKSPPPANEIDALGKSDIIEENTASSIKKSAASVEFSVIKQNTPASVKKSISSPKSKVLKQKASSPRVDLSVKSAISLKRKTAVVKSITVLNPLQAIVARRNQEANIIKTPIIGEKKVSKHPAASLPPKTSDNGVLSMKGMKYKNVKHASPTKNQDKVAKTENCSDDIKENTLCVIEPKKENMELDLIQQTSENSREIMKSESAISDESESDSEEVTESKLDLSRNHRRTVTVHPDEKFSIPHKLRFRRGKVVDLQPEINGPRRLRFRRIGRVVGENPNDNGEVGTGRFRRGELVGSVSNDPGSEAQTVVLKHQDMQGGKDSQGLFNHVIEQTATKLVETRKSKVKALVGAFETVISLQDSKQQSELAF